MTVKAEFVISAKDRTREAIEGAQKRLESLDRTARMLRYAFAGYIFGEFVRSVVDTDIKLQSMRYTLEAATGSMAGAREEMQFLFQTSDKLGVSIRDLGQYYARMAAIATDSGYSLKEFHQEFVNISGGMRVLHLDARHTQYAWLALQEIMAQGTVKMRHLTRQLSIDFPTALQAMALGMNTTVGHLFDLVHKKALQGHQAMQALSKGLHEMYGPQIQAASQGLQADLTRVGNAFTEVVDASDRTGAFDSFGQSMNRLAATIKDPAFINGISTFVNAMSTMVSWGAHGLGAVTGDLDRLAIAFRGLSNAEMMHIKTSGTLGKAFDSVNTKIAALQSRIHQMQHPGFDLIQSGLNLFDYSGQKKHLNALESQLTTLIAMRHNLGRQIAKQGSGAQFTGIGSDHAAHKVHPLTKAQQDAFSFIANLEKTQSDALEKVKTKAQQWQDKMAQAMKEAAKLKGTKMYSGAMEEIALLKKEHSQILAVAAARKKQADETKALNKEDQKQQKYVESLQKDAKHWQDVLEPMRKVRAEAKRLTEEYQRGMLSWHQFMAALRRNQHESQKAFGSMNQYAVQAARSMQSAFATFLYDPFQGGLRGMVHSFADALRKMVAQWLAAQAIMGAAKALSGSGGWEGALGSMLSSMGSGHAYGGDVYAGTPYPVGEQGPELFVPGQNGHIVPNHALGRSGNVTFNVDARGAGPDEVSKLLAMRQGVIKEVKGLIVHHAHYGAFPA